tara:strand:+ start:472 stop:3366 length:2895 start_codon:yes stop_codon:yes gene_type:complete
MDRLFDVNLTVLPPWTDGNEWDDANPAQEIERVYRRVFSTSEEDAPEYRIDPGDNFFIGAHPTEIVDWTPRTLPWTFDIPNGRDGNPLSFYFGVQRGEREIDFIESHSPYIKNATGDVIVLGADYHRFFGLKAKDSDPLLKLSKNNRGGEVHNAVLNNAGLIDTQGYAMFDWVLRKLTFLNTILKALDIPVGSSNVSTQVIEIRGTGDIGMVIRSGHSDMEVIGGTITNENHEYSENQTLLYGLEIEAGDKAIVREIEISGFSGNGFKFDCEVDVKNLVSDHNGAGIEFMEASTARDCMVTWTRQLAGQSFAYYFHKDGELNNSGCNLDEVGGLGVVVAGPGATVTINGGDYRAHLPLPFLSAQGPCTFVLNNVTVNGVLYNETVELLEGEAWRGEKATVTPNVIPVYANKALSLPYMHIPEMADAIAVQGSQRPFESVITLPSGARIAPTRDGSLRYIPGEAWLHLDPGETGTDYFRYSTETLIYMHTFEILPSPEVGAKVVQPDGFSGSGWSNSDGTYYANGTSSPLTASYNFEEGEVYLISLKLVDRKSGGVIPSIGSAQGQYSHYIDGTEVWLIRAPANANSVSVTGQGFKGNVQNIYVRKLLRTETPAVPTLEASVDGNTATLEWDIVPVARLRDLYPPDIHVQNQVLDHDTQSGYYRKDETKSYLFENVTSTGKRKGISLYGAVAVEVDGFVCTGGYTGANDTWQVGIQADLYNPYAKIQQLGNLKIDLGLDSNLGNYNAQFGNSDPIVINGAYDGEESYLYSAHLYNADMRRGSDAVTDIKKNTEVNQAYYYGACKMLRTHKHGKALVANTDFEQSWGTREVFSPTHSPAIIELWNCTVEGERCVTKSQLNEQKKDDSYYFSGRGPLAGNQNSIEILKTYPTLNDLNRFAMTDMQFEVSSNGGSTWSSLDVPNVGLPGVIGVFRRTLSFSSGTYQIRCRCLNGALTGAWSNTISITV